MATAKTNPVAAAAVFASLFAAALASSPAATDSSRAPGQSQVTQQQQVQRDNAPQSQSASSSSIVNPQPADDPKRRLHYQRRNPFRQVRRRMERQGWKLSGRQWRNLSKIANRLRLAGAA